MFIQKKNILLFLTTLYQAQEQQKEGDFHLKEAREKKNKQKTITIIRNPFTSLTSDASCVLKHNWI